MTRIHNVALVLADYCGFYKQIGEQKNSGYVIKFIQIPQFSKNFSVSIVNYFALMR